MEIHVQLVRVYSGVIMALCFLGGFPSCAPAAAAVELPVPMLNMMVQL